METASDGGQSSGRVGKEDVLRPRRLIGSGARFGYSGGYPRQPSPTGPSTYFHRRVTHPTALRALRLGAWSAVMGAHHKGRATTSEGPARPPEGSLFTATGGRHRRLTMSRHSPRRSLRRSQGRRRAASYPEAAKNDHMYHPPMKVSTSTAGAARRRAAGPPGRIGPPPTKVRIRAGA